MTAQQLKNSILQMAVQGKLVPQDPNDEPASVFVDQIRKEQERLIKEKIIKKEKFTSAIEDYDEQLPSGWCYVKVGELTSLVTKQTGFDYSKRIKPNLSGTKLDGMIPMIQTKNFKGKDFSFETDYYIPLSIAEEVPKIMLDSKCMLLSIVGSIGNIGIYEKKNIAMIGGAICKVKLLSEQLYDYLFYFFQSPYGQKEIQKNMKATAQVTITVQDVREIVVKMPPLAEQKRIVKKIEELLPYIDKYGVAETKLSALNTAFPEALKKSILQEAVQGKLVPQNPDDEPASVLLERIRAEKQALIKAGKIKKEKPLPPITEEEIPFEIPGSWCWCRLSDIVYFIGGYAYNSSDFIHKSRNQVLRLGNVKNDELKLSAKPVFITDELANETVGFKCRTDDILLTMTGTRLKRDYFFTVRIQSESPPLYINQRVGCLRAFDSNMAHWLTWILKSEAVLLQVFQYETGTANQGNLGAENILKTMIPLPPLAEQNRIVEKIEEIMPIISTI